MAQAAEITVDNLKGSKNMYRVSHLVIDLGWVDFDMSFPPFCSAAKPLLPNSHQPRQNWADSGTITIEVNQNHVYDKMGCLVFHLMNS